MNFGRHQGLLVNICKRTRHKKKKFYVRKMWEKCRNNNTPTPLKVAHPEPWFSSHYLYLNTINTNININTNIMQNMSWQGRTFALMNPTTSGLFTSYCSVVGGILHHISPWWEDDFDVHVCWINPLHHCMSSCRWRPSTITHSSRSFFESK